MKRHINSLLQRKRADFDSAQNARVQVQRLESRSESVQLVLVKDGYDWLQQIGVGRADVARAPTIAP